MQRSNIRVHSSSASAAYAIAVGGRGTREDSGAGPTVRKNMAAIEAGEELAKSERVYRLGAERPFLAPSVRV